MPDEKCHKFGKGAKRHPCEIFDITAKILKYDTAHFDKTSRREHNDSPKQRTSLRYLKTDKIPRGIHAANLRKWRRAKGRTLIIIKELQLNVCR